MLLICVFFFQLPNYHQYEKLLKVTMFGFHLVAKAIKISPPSPVLFFTLSTLLLLFGTEAGWAASASSAIQEGIVDYQQKDYAKAESNFSKAAQELPDNPNLNYNLGNSQYKAGKFKEALQTYTKAMVEESPPELKGKALYNTGNALFRLGKLEEAATAYKKALEVDPKDMDAKFNLEFVREQLKKKKEEQKKQDQNSNSKDKQDQQPKDPPGNKEDDQGNPSDPQDPNASGEPKKEEPSPAEQQETAQAQEGAISKDQADHWLSALNEDLKKFRQKQASKETAGRPNQSRDW
ncbi:MAG: tetratricopeptide repeat protein [Nitrospinae bacterium]|jgi:Ca-activated chloride channel homolog|nr:tetratricopeptide repeat protein [Nitrospinota bacterium]MDA1108517.1 tetratricopeptide repeat protein [Nitrospinota bacterium]